MCRNLIIIIALVLVAPSFASADLTKCNGVWTNKPCAAPGAAHFEESRPTPRSQQSIDADQKKTLIGELETRRLSVRSQYGLEIGVSAERSLCLSTETSVADCSHAIEEKERYIDDRAIAAANLRAAEERQQASSAATDSKDPTTVTIIQQSGDQYIGGRHYPRNTPWPVGTIGENRSKPLPTPVPPKIEPPHSPRSRPRTTNLETSN